MGARGKAYKIYLPLHCTIDPAGPGPGGFHYTPQHPTRAYPEKALAIAIEISDRVQDAYSRLMLGQVLLRLRI